MQEIKVRAWVEPNVEVCRPYMNYHPEFNGDINEIFARSGIKPKHPYSSKITYMLFTNLHDCKRTEEHPEGQEIYEGDILAQNGYWSVRIEYQKGVMWVRDLDKVRYNNLILNTPIVLFDFSGWEVVGNIFENSDLLEIPSKPDFK